MTLKNFERMEQEYQFLPFSDPEVGYLECGWMGYMCDVCKRAEELTRMETDGDEEKTSP